MKKRGKELNRASGRSFDGYKRLCEPQEVEGVTAEKLKRGRRKRESKTAKAWGGKRMGGLHKKRGDLSHHRARRGL